MSEYKIGDLATVIIKGFPSRRHFVVRAKEPGVSRSYWKVIGQPGDKVGSNSVWKDDQVDDVKLAYIVADLEDLADKLLDEKADLMSLKQMVADLKAYFRTKPEEPTVRFTTVEENGYYWSLLQDPAESSQPWVKIGRAERRSWDEFSNQVTVVRE